MGAVTWNILLDQEAKSLWGYHRTPVFYRIDQREHHIGFPVLGMTRYQYVMRVDDLRGWVRCRPKETSPHGDRVSPGDPQPMAERPALTPLECMLLREGSYGRWMEGGRHLEYGQAVFGRTLWVYIIDREALNGITQEVVGGDIRKQVLLSLGKFKKHYPEAFASCHPAP